MFTVKNCIMFTMETYRHIACDLCQEGKKKNLCYLFIELYHVYHFPQTPVHEQ